MKQLLLAAVTGVAGATVMGQGQQPRFESRLDLVVVSAVVRDQQDALVRGLGQGDFELYEDGKPIPVSTFAEVNADDLAPQDDGRFVVLLLDDLVSHPQFTTRIKQIAHGFADRMGARDVMAVVYVNGGAQATTAKASEVRAAIDRFKPFGTSLSTRQGLADHVVETIGSLATQLSVSPHRRKVIVCIGPAQYFNPGIRRDGRAEHSLRDVSRADVTTYVVDPLGLTRGLGVTGQMEGYARETGGAAFSNVNVFDAVVDQIWQESGTYYLLGYEMPRPDGRMHTIDVRVKRPGLQVRARRTRG